MSTLSCTLLWDYLISEVLHFILHFILLMTFQANHSFISMRLVALLLHNSFIAEWLSFNCPITRLLPSDRSPYCFITRLLLNDWLPYELNFKLLQSLRNCRSLKSHLHSNSVTYSRLTCAEFETWLESTVCASHCRLSTLKVPYFYLLSSFNCKTSLFSFIVQFLLQNFLISIYCPVSAAKLPYFHLLSSFHFKTSLFRFIVQF